jgi:hypothetical protein
MLGIAATTTTHTTTNVHDASATSTIWLPGCSCLLAALLLLLIFFCYLATSYRRRVTSYNTRLLAIIIAMLYEASI